MVTFQKVICTCCEAEYWIGWVKFDKTDEYCSNCGNQGDLVVDNQSFNMIIGNHEDKIGKNNNI